MIQSLLFRSFSPHFVYSLESPGRGMISSGGRTKMKKSVSHLSSPYLQFGSRLCKAFTYFLTFLEIERGRCDETLLVEALLINSEQLVIQSLSFIPEKREPLPCGENPSSQVTKFGCDELEVGWNFPHSVLGE